MAAIKRKGESVWNGGGKDGKGMLSTESGAVSNLSYNTGKRFGDEKGTNPEELLAIAHAGCFNMALAFGLGGQGKTPDELRTTAVVSMEQEGTGYTIKKIELQLRGRVPDMSADDFKKAAEEAKAGCPVSKLFKGAEITLDAQLQS
jgi:osmotically inducible protein OsmC